LQVPEADLLEALTVSEPTLAQFPIGSKEAMSLAKWSLKAQERIAQMKDPSDDLTVDNDGETRAVGLQRAKSDFVTFVKRQYIRKDLQQCKAQWAHVLDAWKTMLVFLKLHHPDEKVRGEMRRFNQMKGFVVNNIDTCNDWVVEARYWSFLIGFKINDMNNKYAFRDPEGRKVRRWSLIQGPDIDMTGNDVDLALLREELHNALETKEGLGLVIRMHDEYPDEMPYNQDFDVVKRYAKAVTAIPILRNEIARHIAAKSARGTSSGFTVT